MATWGTDTVYILVGTYQPPSADAGINEIPILPGAVDPASVIQQSGRTRRVIRWEGYVTSWSGYTSLYDDYVGGVEKTFSGPDSVSLSCVISRLSPPRYEHPGHITYNITLMEA